MYIFYKYILYVHIINIHSTHTHILTILHTYQHITTADQLKETQIMQIMNKHCSDINVNYLGL